jgi:hypothetical protein
MKGSPLPIEDLLRQQREIVAQLRAQGLLDLHLAADDMLRKFFVMACGSYFEDWISAELVRFGREGGGAVLGALIEGRLKRQYHTLFDWGKSQNVNKFLTLFGPAVKSDLQGRINQDTRLKQGMGYFMDIGHRRNELAHSNIAFESFDLTLDELEDRFRQAHGFVTFLLAELERAALADRTGRG